MNQAMAAYSPVSSGGSGGPDNLRADASDAEYGGWNQQQQQQFAQSAAPPEGGRQRRSSSLSSG
jgi:hypothetical protein